MKKIKQIVIDCGHGGIDKNGKYTTAPAKQAKVDGKMIYEGVINRTIGGMLAHLFQWDGYEVIFTVDPNDSRDISLDHRVRVANKYPKALFLSIHCNAFNGKARGFEIFTTKGQTKSDELAQEIYNEVDKVSKDFNGVMRPDNSDGDSDKEVDFYVLRKTKGIAVLIECFFFDNKEDLELFNNKEHLVKLVSALYKGIINYIEK